MIPTRATMAEPVIQLVNVTINPSVDTVTKDGWGNSAKRGSLTRVRITIALIVHNAYLKESPTNAFVMEERTVCFLCRFLCRVAQKNRAICKCVKSIIRDVAATSARKI